MKVYDAASIRNVALVGHTASGKTQLVSAILSDASMVNRFGKVDEGTTITDYDEEEIARKHTLSGVVELVSRKAFVFKTDGSGTFAEAPVPAEMTGAVDSAREALIEMVAEADEALMEKFFEAGTLGDDEVLAGLRSATAAGKL